MPSLAELKATVKRLVPDVAWPFFPEQIRGRNYLPAKGKVSFGDLRRLYPLSSEFGYDRGRPLDRYYIENFLKSNEGLICGRVLEIGENTYTLAFGGPRVTQSDVLHVYEGNPAANFVGDLTDAPNLPSNSFDCLIITQTLHLIYDIRAAFATIHRILKPGGVLLATVPGISQIGDEDWAETWFWALTIRSLRRLAEEVFPASTVDVATHGNVLAAIAFLQGLSDDELTRAELDFSDARYQLLLTLRASKPDRAFFEPMKDRWNYRGAHQSPYDSEVSYKKGIKFLDGHGSIEDWGCGTAFARKFVTKSSYIGIDASPSSFTDKVVDLQEYKSETDCIFMRHVLEHNWGWRRILENALASFRKRMVLIIFTPLGANERKIGDNQGIPDLALPRPEILEYFRGLSYDEEAFVSETEYGRECVFYLEKAQ